MSRYSFTLATEIDDAALRLRMQEDVLDGSISTTFRREPSYFYGTQVQGEHGQVIKCTDTTTDTIVALGARTELSAYLNGQPARLGYLCDLRGTNRVRRGTLLARGFRYLKSLHTLQPVELYYTMILSDNQTAVDALTRHRAGLPRYRSIGRFFTPTLHLDKKREHTFDPTLTITTADLVSLELLVEFINRQYQRYQFAPVLSINDLQSDRFRGLSLETVFVALKDDAIVGCIACWDQQAFKQVHVDRYSGFLKYARPLYNQWAKWTARKRLPDQGERLSFFYLALIAIEGDDASIFRDLLESIYARRRQMGWHFFMAGLHERHPLEAELHRFRHIPVYGNLYIAHWEDGDSAFDQLDDRPPHVEIAAL